MSTFAPISRTCGPSPGTQGAAITPGELAAIADSLRGWQLGETSDGSHLRAIACKYAEQIGDADFVEMMELFIAEEQRHGATLGRFLDLAGEPRAESDWGNTLFRLFRHCLANMETFTTPVVMAETHALVFYQAIRQASGCPVLRRICEQLLADEIPHIRMQCERCFDPPPRSAPHCCVRRHDVASTAVFFTRRESLWRSGSGTNAPCEPAATASADSGTLERRWGTRGE